MSVSAARFDSFPSPSLRGDVGTLQTRWYAALLDYQSFRSTELLTGVQLPFNVVGSRGFSAGLGAGTGREPVKALVFFGAALLAVSLFLPWFRLHAGGAGETYSSLGGAGYILAVLIVVAVVLSLTVLFVGPEHNLVSAGVIALATVVAVVAVVILVCEIVAAFIPTWFVPETFRRSLLDVSASYGAWAALIGALAAFVGIAGQQWLDQISQLTRSFDEANRQRAGVALCATVFFVVILGWLRYQPWMRGSAGEYWFQLSGWATPWAGSATLIALGLLVAALILLVLGNMTLAVVLAGLGAWIFTFLAAGVILGGNTVNLLPIDDYTARDLAEKTPVTLPEEMSSQSVLDARISVQVAWGAWLTYFAGVGAAVSAMWLMFLAKPGQSGGQW